MNLTRFRIPAGIVIVALFGIEILAIGLGVTSVGTGDFAIVNTAIYMVVMVALSVFYSTVAIKVLIQLRRVFSTRGRSSSMSGGSGTGGSAGGSADKTPRKPVSSNALWTTTIRLLVSGVALISFVVIGLFTVSPWFLRQETGMAWVWVALHIMLHVRAFATILALRPHHRRVSSKPRTSGTGKEPTAATAHETGRSKSGVSTTAVAATSQVSGDVESASETEESEEKSSVESKSTSESS